MLHSHTHAQKCKDHHNSYMQSQTGTVPPASLPKLFKARTYFSLWKRKKCKAPQVEPELFLFADCLLSQVFAGSAVDHLFWTHTTHFGFHSAFLRQPELIQPAASQLASNRQGSGFPERKGRNNIKGKKELI